MAVTFCQRPQQRQRRFCLPGRLRYLCCRRSRWIQRSWRAAIIRQSAVMTVIRSRGKKDKIFQIDYREGNENEYILQAIQAALLIESYQPVFDAATFFGFTSRIFLSSSHIISIAFPLPIFRYFPSISFSSSLFHHISFPLSKAQIFGSSSSDAPQQQASVQQACTCAARR